MIFFVLLCSFFSVSLVETQLDPVNPLEVNQEIIDFLDQHIDRNASPMLKLEMLVSAVFKNDALGFTYVPETKTAIQTFADKSGNCLSFTNLFIAMARSLELDARFREVNVAPTWSKHGHLVVFNRHVNVVVYIRGRPYLVDLFPRIDRIEVGGRVVPDERGYAHYYNNVGADWFAKGSPSLALRYFEKALGQDQTASFVWANLGVSQAHLGRLEEAEKSYRRALELDDNHPVAMTNLAELMKKTDRHEAAAALEEKIQDFKQKNPFYHFSLGEEAYESGEFRVSLGHYREAIKRNPKEPHFHHAMAKAYTQLGLYEEALESLRKAVKYSPDETGRNRYNQKLQALNSHLADPSL